MDAKLYSHRLPFSAEELLLLAGLSSAVLEDATVVEGLGQLAESPDMLVAIHQLQRRLKLFISNGVQRNIELRGETLTTSVVRAVLADEAELSDKQLELQS